MKYWDVIIIGGGLIGISLALELNRNGARVVVLDRGEPGHEASHAAAGILAWCDPHLRPELVPLATASARLYPDFVRELEAESGTKVDYRDWGTLEMVESADSLALRSRAQPGIRMLSAEELGELEPGLNLGKMSAAYLPEASVDPRQLVRAALASAKKRGVHIAPGSAAQEIIVRNGQVAGVRTSRADYLGEKAVNCAGAWAAEIACGIPADSCREWKGVGDSAAGDGRSRVLPMRPVKGQMLEVVCPIRYDAHGSPAADLALTHVVRAPQVYMAPRSDGRILIGSTLEEAGFDKRVNPATIHRLHESACALAPAIANTKILESWAGLRPATSDHLPVLGATAIPGYFIAGGHFRDGILLAPITARLMSQVVCGEIPAMDTSAFAAERFGSGRQP